MLRQNLPQRLNVRRVCALAPDQDGFSPILPRRQGMDRQPLALGKCREHAFRQQRNAHAGDNAAEHRVIGAEFNGAFRHLAALRIPALQPLAVRAAMLERDDGFGKIAVLADGRKAGCRNDHRLFFERKCLVERRIRDRLGDKRGIELAGENRRCQYFGITVRSSSATSG